MLTGFFLFLPFPKLELRWFGFAQLFWGALMQLQGGEESCMGRFVTEQMEGNLSRLIAVKVVSRYQDSTPDIKVSS